MKFIQPLHLSHTVTNLCTNGRDDYTKADVQVLIALVKCLSHCFPSYCCKICVCFNTATHTLHDGTCRIQQVIELIHYK